MPLPVFPEFRRAVLLYIDDNQDVLDSVKSFLECFGHTVLTAPNGGSGLELASIHAVDIVIVDYLMPKMNGQEVAIEMRRLKPGAPIIMLSAAADVPQQALELVDAFISKDCLATELLPAIAKLHRRGWTPPPCYDA